MIILAAQMPCDLIFAMIPRYMFSLHGQHDAAITVQLKSD